MEDRRHLSADHSRVHLPQSATADHHNNQEAHLAPTTKHLGNSRRLLRTRPLREEVHTHRCQATFRCHLPASKGQGHHSNHNISNLDHSTRLLHRSPACLSHPNRKGMAHHLRQVAMVHLLLNIKSHRKVCHNLLEVCLQRQTPNSRLCSSRS